jgi:hypothetical protein
MTKVTSPGEPPIQHSLTRACGALHTRIPGPCLRLHTRSMWSNMCVGVRRSLNLGVFVIGTDTLSLDGRARTVALVAHRREE